MFENCSMYEAVRHSCINFPKGTAIYYEGKKISYKRLDQMICDTADILSNVLNIGCGDVVLVAQPNIPNTLILIYAINKIGAIVNLVHPYTPFAQIKEIIEKTNAKCSFLFEQRVFKELNSYRNISNQIFLTRIEDYLPLGKKLTYHFFKNSQTRKALTGFRYFYELRPTGKGSPTIINKEKETSVLLHSGSTTGDPKTICLSDSNFNYISSRTPEFMSCTADFIRNKGMLSVLPSFHGFGFGMTMHTPLLGQYTCVLMPKFSAKGVAKLMKKTNIACICGVPSMFESLLNSNEFVNSPYLKNLHVCFCGGDSLSISIKEKFDNVMKEHGSHCQVFEGYGLTEGAAVNCVNTYEHNKLGSIGYPISNSEFKIVNENGEFLPAGEIGQIIIKSPAIMNGYFEDEESTSQAIIDGWLYTGDLGYIDEEGYIFFTQRLKRVVKVSAVGVFPTEIEKLVLTIPEVKGCCAIQIPDQKLIHAIKLFVVSDCKKKGELELKIMSLCTSRLIRWSIPKEIEFIDELPLTLLGKVDFNKLQKIENQKRGIDE